MNYSIPFHKSSLLGRELDYVAEAVRGGQIAGDGPFAARCREFLQQRFGIERVFLTPSGSAALDLVAAMCWTDGDEVILPSFTFVSTANAVARVGARPVFVDIRDDTLNIDTELIEAAITPRTKAIVPVHYAGVSCDMDRILKIAVQFDLMVVEDAAQAVDAYYRERPLGTLGALGMYSFHGTKNFTSGQGGALCVNDPQLLARSEVLYEKGTNRAQFLRGEATEYEWVDVSSSYTPSELACAFLWGQLEAMDEAAQKRATLYANYERLLQPLVTDGFLKLLTTPQECRRNHHLFGVLLADGVARARVIDDLARAGIQVAAHFVPLHSSRMGKQLGGRLGDLPVTESCSARLLRLPFYLELSRSDQERIVEQLHTTLLAHA